MAFVPDAEQPSTESRFIPDSPAKADVPAANDNAPNSGIAGMVNFGANALGLLGDTGQNILNLGRAAIGTATTAAGRPDLAPEIQKNAIGTSEWLKKILRDTGIPSLSPDNPSHDNKTATTAYDFASRGGMVPGSALPAAASIIAEKIGGPQWAGVGAMLPSAATMAFNELRAPVLARQEAQNQVRDATLRRAQDAGYVLPPSAVNPSMGGNAAESFAGKSALNQEAQLKNQQVTNTLVRQELRLPENAPITEQSLDTARTQASAPYREVSSLSPLAANVLQRLRDARQEATVNFRHYDMTGTPQSLRDAQAADAQATSLERVLERQAQGAGRPELVQQLRDARTYIAKTYDVERALNLGNGNVDAQIIGRALDRGRPLSGNLETIARFSEGPGRQFTREASKVPAAGVSALNWPMAAALGVEGHHYLGAKGLALASLPFVRGGVRQGILSDVYQSNFNRPDYTPNVMPQGALQTGLQQAIIAQQKK